MASLGKCLVFYFKYQPEMVRFYWQKHQPDEFADPETVKMVKAVGDQCCQEIGEFLLECGKIIEKHFGAIGKCSVGKPNDTKWHVSSGIWWQAGSKPHNGNWKMKAGVTIPRNKTEVIPWVWGLGKNEAEEKMMLEFGDSVKRSSDVDMEAGTIALARIPILPEALDGFDLDRGALLNQVEQAFTLITKPKFDNVYNYVKTLKS